MKSVPDCALYDTLRVPTNATDQQINRAFRALALRYHPDKQASLSSMNAGASGSLLSATEGPHDSGASANAHKESASCSDLHAPTDPGSAFNMIKSAHEILSDPEKRLIYDQHGQLGLALLEYTGGNIDIARILLSPVKTVAGLLVIGAVIFVLFTAILLVQCKLDLWITWRWRVVLLPSWILAGCACLIAMAAAVLIAGGEGVDASSDEEGRPQEMDKVSPLLTCLGVLVYTAQSILWSMQADLVINWRWWQVFQPVCVYELLTFIYALRKSIVRTKLKLGGEHGKAKVQLGAKTRALCLLRSMAVPLLRLFFVYLLVVYEVLGGWTMVVVFLPIYLLLALPVIDYMTLGLEYPPETLLLLIYPLYTVILAHIKLSTDRFLNKKLYRWYVVLLPTYLILIAGRVVLGLMIFGMIAFRENLIKGLMEISRGKSRREAGRIAYR